MKYLSHSLGLALAWFAAAVQPAVAGSNLIQNPGFESGNTGWGLFVPAESKEKGCRFSVANAGAHSGQACAEMSSEQFARFALSPNGVIQIQPGERYRLVAWVKGEAGAQADGKTPGVVLRLILRKGNTDAAGNPAIYVGLNSKVAVVWLPQAPDLRKISTSIPSEWTKVEAVFEVPKIESGIDNMGLGVFGLETKGKVYLDDVELEKVDAQTPLSPVVFNALEPVAAKAGLETTDEEALASLDLEAPGMEAVKAAAQSGNLEAVKQAYLEYRRTKCPAKWSLPPMSDKPEAATDAAGDEVCAHRIGGGWYKAITAPVDMGKDFNWTYNPVPKTDPSFTEEWTWCAVARMQFWNRLSNAYARTHDEKYAKEWVAQLFDFTAKNNMYAKRPGESTLWRTLDSAIRIGYPWPSAYFRFLNSPEFTPEAQWVYLRSINDHIQLLKAGLEVKPHRYGNWVSTECSGLYTMAVLFPELKQSAELRKFALERLLEEANCTIAEDGFEEELTPNYHYVAIDGYIAPLKLAKLNHLEVPEAFRTKVLSMYQAPIRVMDQTGNAVPTNDSGIINAASMANEGLRLLGDDPILTWAATGGKKGKPLPEFDVLPYAGFYAMRGGWAPSDAFLFFRAGPVGIAHQHEDMLEVAFRAWNKTFLFDPGNYIYDHSNWRRFAIGTASHNTIIVDGKWQHRGSNKPPVTEKVTNPTHSTPLFDFVSGCYNAGYQQNVYNSNAQYSPDKWVGPKDLSVSHTRRVLFLKPYYALLLDTLDGTGKHQYDAHFHLDSPSAKLDPATQTAVSQNADDQPQLALYPLERENLEAEIVQGQKEPLLGWYPAQQRPIPTVRFRKTQEAPATFATFLYPFKGEQPAFAASDLKIGDPAVWAQKIKTGREELEVILAKDNQPRAIKVPAGLTAAAQAKCAGMVIRRPASLKKTVVGAWDLAAYGSKAWSFETAAPASLLWCAQGGSLVVYNAGEAPVHLKVSKPFAKEADLAAGEWVEISKKEMKPAKSPLEGLEPLDSKPAIASYDAYLSKLADQKSDAAAQPVRVEAASMKLPDAAVLGKKVGVQNQAVCKWDAPLSVLSTRLKVPTAGWYRIKLRYCAQGNAVRSLLIGGKAPFAQAENFFLPGTQGEAPSDGWSNVTNDWSEIFLGAPVEADGWKIYLPAGDAEIALRNESSGCNVNWLELVPVSK